jgi:hypothetical protein
MRPTQNFILPNGDVAVLNEYITFGEKTALNGIYQKETTQDVIAKEVQDFIFKTTIVSITNKEGIAVTDILNYISNLPADEGVVVLNKATDIVIGKKKD